MTPQRHFINPTNLMKCLLQHFRLDFFNITSTKVLLFHLECIIKQINFFETCMTVQQCYVSIMDAIEFEICMFCYRHILYTQELKGLLYNPPK